MFCVLHGEKKMSCEKQKSHRRDHRLFALLRERRRGPPRQLAKDPHRLLGRALRHPVPDVEDVLPAGSSAVVRLDEAPLDGALDRVKVATPTEAVTRCS